MSDTYFIDQSTPIQAAWLNDVNNYVYSGVVPGTGPDSSKVTYTPAGTGAVATTVQAKLREFPSIDDFSGADDGAKLTAALAAHPIVRIPAGSRTSSTTVTIGANKCVFAEQPGSVSWTVTTDNQAFILNGAYSELHGIYITKSGSHTKNLVEVGTTLVKADRAKLSDLRVVAAGNDGIQVINGNIGSLANIQSISNGRDGINFTLDTADNNAWTFDGYIDVGSNVRDGLHFEGGTSVSNPNASRTHTATYVVAQSNGRYGVYANSIGNQLAVYLESNVTKDLYLDTYAQGNVIRILAVGGFSTITEVTTNTNQLITSSMNADYLAGFWSKVVMSGRTGKGWYISNDDGTAGAIAFEKTGARAFKLEGVGSNADFVTSFTNSNASFANSIAVQGAVYPTTDNTRVLGTASFRWSQTYTGFINLSAAAGTAAAGTVNIGGTTATTVGAAGGAAALPATPLGYLIANVAGTQVKIPYYSN